MDSFDLYPILEFIHIVSAAVLFGASLGTSFYVWHAHKSGNAAAVSLAAQSMLKAENRLIIPAIFVQILSGAAMIVFVGFKWDADWLIAAYVLFGFAGMFWGRLIKTLRRAADMAETSARAGKPLPEAYHQAMKTWQKLAFGALTAVILIFYTMVLKLHFWG